MPKQHKVMGFIAAAAMLAAPAVADGYANRSVNRGPAPLQAHAQPTPPEPGCYLIGDDTWSCPPLAQTAQRTHSSSHRGYTSTFVSQGYASLHAGHSHAYGAECGYNSYAPRPARVSYAPRPAPRPVRYTPRGVSIDIAGFDGGVGNGVNGGYYGGGGGFAFVSASSSASVFSSAAASLTFQGGFRGGGGKRHHGGGKHHGGGCNSCGGGHKGGGH